MRKPRRGAGRTAVATIALAAMSLTGCVTGHEGVDAITGVAANILIWGIP